MTRTTTAARPGFTLVELLIVLTIIAVIAALSAVALFGTTDTQRRNSTDQVLDKLQKTLDDEYQTVNKKAASSDAANGSIPQAVVLYADGLQRARTFWAAANLRREFPQSFAEAGAAVTVVPGVTLPVLTPFAGLANASNPHEESAALLYMILSQKSASGGGASTDGGNVLGPTRDVTLNGRSFKVFVDSWGNSIGFRRWDTSGELQGSDYAPAGAGNKDPLDPSNLVFGWTDATKRTWAGTNSGLFPNWPAGNLPPLNRRAAVYSPGKDKTVGNLDDQLAYRLLKLGARGIN